MSVIRGVIHKININLILEKFCKMHKSISDRNQWKMVPINHFVLVRFFGISDNTNKIRKREKKKACYKSYWEYKGWFLNKPH